MNANRRKQIGLLLVIVVMAMLLAAVTGDEAAARGRKRRARVLSPNRAWYGQTYEEWAVKWWQWAGSVEVESIEDHPLVADGDMDCSLGQKGKVWFLGGTYGGTGTANRECDVPKGKALFFPIVNVLCSPLAGDPDDEEFLLTCAENPGVAYGFEFQMNPVSATIDGRPVRRLQRFYIQPEDVFHIDPVPYPNVFDIPDWISVPEGTEGDAATTGYYLLLAPLSKGEHTITFEGEFTGDYPSYFDITYTLHVK